MTLDGDVWICGRCGDPECGGEVHGRRDPMCVERPPTMVPGRHYKCLVRSAVGHPRGYHQSDLASVALGTCVTLVTNPYVSGLWWLADVSTRGITVRLHLTGVTHDAEHARARFREMFQPVDEMDNEGGVSVAHGPRLTEQ